MANEDHIGVGSPDGTIIGRSDAPIGFFGAAGASKGAALTAQLTTITIADAAGTPDYAIQAVTNSTAYGFASAAEAITFLYVVKNLQTRVAELEVIVEGLGLAAAN